MSPWAPITETRPTYQLMIRIPGLGVILTMEGREVVKDALGRLGSVVENEHSPRLDLRSICARRDDGRLVVMAVLPEVTDGLEKMLIMFMAGKGPGSAPNLWQSE